ncbi:hypothetical protein [Salsuginibacillus kocurii]|uniref:hypothetical protein n=1 Tax=Salsuginibacillus kocurii TaxID=427078 RepID=UPI000371670E|nr:hypothetical protein [Salsuginibacillus kocurii]
MVDENFEEEESKFEIGQTVYYQGEEMTVINELERTLVLEYVHFVPVDDDDHERIVVRKEKVTLS